MFKIRFLVVLTDGRYIRVLYNKHGSNSLYVLKSEDCSTLERLYYDVIVGFRTETNMKLLSDFLFEQLTHNEFEKLIIIAPKLAFDELNMELPEELKEIIAGVVTQDALSKSINNIENILSDLSVI